MPVPCSFLVRCPDPPLSPGGEAPVSAAIDEFLTEYQRATRDDSDPARVGALYADTFLTLTPSGAHTATREALLAEASARSGLLTRLGHRDTVLVSATPTWLGDDHCLLSTRWRLEFTPDDRGTPRSAELESDCLLRRDGATFRIVVYLVRQDMRRVLADAGV